LTVSDRPTLWAYLPYTMADAPHAEVIIQAESSDQEIYRGTFPLDTMPGITGIRLPESVPALDMGESYRWYVDVPCAPADSVLSTSASATTSEREPATITGVARRVAASPELTQALKTASTVPEQLAAYGEYHIWYDLLSELSDIRLSSQNNEQIDRLWVDLLSDEAGAGLGDYAEAPLVGIVTAD